MLGINDPEKRSRLGQGLIALGGSMMKAGGPSYTPNNFLGALGDGMNAFSKSYTTTQDDALKRLYTKAQIGNLTANTSLHGLQAQQLQAQAAARAAFNGVTNPNAAGSTAITTLPGAPGAPGAPAVPGAPAGAPAPGGPAPGAPAAPGPQGTPGQPLQILPPALRPGSPQAAPAQPAAPAGVPGAAPAGPVAPGAPAQPARPPVGPQAGPAAPQAGPQAPVAPQGGNDVGSQIMGRIGELNAMAQKARAAGYDSLAQSYSDQALAFEKQAASQGLFLGRDGTAVPVPGYAAGLGQKQQAESAGKSVGEMPGKILMADHESELRMKEQAAKDASGDKKTFDDRAKDMNNSWNQSDYNKKFLQASNIRSGFDRAFADKSGLGTAQLVLDWYKLNDPGSVVSQNEMNSLSTKTQSMPEGLISAVNQALAGGGMSDDTKIKLLKNMDGKYQDQRQTYEKQRDNQRSLAGKIGGIDPIMVIPDVAELHGAWKSPTELAAEQAARAAAQQAPGLGGGAGAPAVPPGLGGGVPRGGLPKFSSPSDPGFADLPKGAQFEFNGTVYVKN
ncbi:hypothetical protein ACN9MF_17835 [Methylobacterium fujisawaense]|uniref:hypothetical protein n=1 Tax=Methylobacterium fujisawaense TaxID=107400 RepID=UPI003CEF3038